MFVFDDAHWADAGERATAAPCVRPLRARDRGPRRRDVPRHRHRSQPPALEPCSPISAGRRASNASTSTASTSRACRHCSCAAGGRRPRGRGHRVRPPARRRDRGQPLLRHRGDPPSRRDQHARTARRPLGRCGSVEDIGLPEGVRDVVGRRLSLLSDDANEALRIAAVVGREFDVNVVATVAECSEDDMVDRLDEALASRLVDEVADRANRLTFSHTLVRSTLIDELSTNRRVRLHKRIGEALEARGAPVVELAHHFCEAATAGGAERAVRYSCEAGRISPCAKSPTTMPSASSSARLDALEALDAPGAEADLLRAERAVAARGGRARPRRRRARPEPRTRSGRPRPPARRRGATRRSRAHAYQGNLGMWARPDDGVAIDIMQEALALLGDTEPEVARPRQGGHRLRHDPRGRRRRPARRRRSDRRSRSQAGDDEAMNVALFRRGVVGVGQRLRPANGSRRRRRLLPRASGPAHRNWMQSGEWHVGHALLVTGDIEAAIEPIASGTPRKVHSRGGAT